MHSEIPKGKGEKKDHPDRHIKEFGLSESELAAAISAARRKPSVSSEACGRISDPFKTVLSAEESEELKAVGTKARIKTAPLSEEHWAKFTKAFTFNTNAIEGSTINQREVAEILEKDKWPDKPKGDISETYGVAKAVEFIRKTDEHASLQLILELHRIVFENSKPFAGKLRENGVEVVVTDGHGGIVHRGAPSTRVRAMLLELARWYDENKNSYSPLVLAAIVHNQFENIHPFQDGNGRVGRLLLNNVLIKNRMPPIDIEFENRQQYYSALQACEQTHSLLPTIELMLKEYGALEIMLKRK